MTKSEVKSLVVKAKILPIADTYISTLYPDANFGDEDSLDLVNQTLYDGSHWFVFSLLKFQLPAALGSGKLFLYCSGQYMASGKKMSLGTCSKNWDEGTLTYNKFLSDIGSYTILRVLDPPSYGYYEVGLDLSKFHQGDNVVVITLSLEDQMPFDTTHQVFFVSKEGSNKPYIILS
jgi:hypothetical protein